MYDIVKLNEKFPEIMVFGEPTDNKILVGSKGLLEIEISFNGIKAHSSNPDKGKSANMNAVEFVHELNEFYNEKIKKDKKEKYEIQYTTMNVGLINGGSAKNSVSANCEVAIDFRIIESKHLNMIKEKLEKLSEKYDCKVRIIEEIEPFCNEIDFVNEIKTANFITEASMINNCKRIILGAGPITAHEINEYITSDSYEKLIEQYKEIIKKVCI